MVLLIQLGINFSNAFVGKFVVRDALEFLIYNEHNTSSENVVMRQVLVNIGNLPPVENLLRESFLLFQMGFILLFFRDNHGYVLKCRKSEEVI